MEKEPRLPIPPSAHLVKAHGEPGEPDGWQPTSEFIAELRKLDEAEREAAAQDIADEVILD